MFKDKRLVRKRGKLKPSYQQLRAMEGKDGAAFAVFGALGLHASQRLAHFLRLDDSNSLSVYDQQIIGGAGRERKFSNGDAAPRAEVELGIVLYQPARLSSASIRWRACS